MNDPNYDNANAGIAGMEQEIQNGAAALTSEQQKEQADQATIATDAAQITKDQSDEAALNATIADLQKQLAQAGGSSIPSTFLRQFMGLQKLSGWQVAGGAAGNTGQQGSKGSATIIQNPDGSMTVAIVPQGGWYNCYCMRRFAGAGTSVPFPTLMAGLVLMQADFIIDATNAPLSHAREFDTSRYNGTTRYQIAGQVTNGELRYFDPSDPDPNNHWQSFAPKIPVPIAAGKVRIEMLGKFDEANQQVTYLAVAVNGKIYQPNVLVKKPTPHKNSSPWWENSVQLDSDGQGHAYQANYDNVCVQFI